MQHLIVELIPDPDLGGYTARLPDVPAYVTGALRSRLALVPGRSPRPSEVG